ncbi:Uncharacterised protein [Mycobacteroides abscessus subsp. abscessus]|nr:Uncharacterised protein [Mycobacteroides abscessus subsp. abscessus]
MSVCDTLELESETSCPVLFSNVLSRTAEAVVTENTAPPCEWCSSTDDVADFRDEVRCGKCRELEVTITEARKFLGFYGLRPLGGSVECDDEEEREHRVGARDAYTELNRIRTSTPAPRPKRSASRTSAAAVKSSGVKSGAVKSAGDKASTATTSPTRRNDVSRPDRAELLSRAEGLLNELTDIDARLAAAEQESGLSAKARIADLTSRREYVLRTLAALEKAQRAMAPS